MTKKTVNCNFIEFGYELLSALPYAYYLHTQGQLKKTISGVDTKCLYFFSSKHEEINKKRSWKNMGVALRSGVPNVAIHTPYFNFNHFKVPDYRKKYANKKYKWEKPTVVICNRINNEWGRPPINYFDLSVLRQIFNLLKDKFQIVYINIEGRKDYYDGETPISIGDFEMIEKRYPEVINIHSLKGKSFNELQLKIFANCNHYITMNGGYSILASYFKGKNIIYAKARTKELQVGSFWRWYPKLNGSEIYYSNNYKDLIEKIKQIYVKEKPKINILCRTSNRPNFFHSMMQGVSLQKHKNINVIVGIENGQPDGYTFKEIAYPVYYDELKIDGKKHRNSREYGMHFPYNLYFNILAKHVKDGWVMYIDDDGIFSKPESLVKIVTAIKDENSLILWRVKVSGRAIPNDDNFGNKPVCKDICGSGFLFHSKHLKSVKWTEWKRGDFRVVNKLYEKLDPVWINDVLTESQREHGAGMGRRDDKKIAKYSPTILKQEIMKVEVINDRYKNKPFSKKGEILTLDSQTARLFIERGLVKPVNKKEGKELFAEKELKNVKETVAEQNKTIKQQKEIIDKQIPELHKTIKTMKAEKIEYKNKMEKKLIDNKEQHDNKIQTMREKHDEKIKKLKNKYEDNLKKTNKKNK